MDIRATGNVALLVLQVPVKREWNEHRRNLVAQHVANAAVAALHEMEGQWPDG